jgi:hypothetical protein
MARRVSASEAITHDYADQRLSDLGAVMQARRPEALDIATSTRPGRNGARGSHVRFSHCESKFCSGASKSPVLVPSFSCVDTLAEVHRWRCDPARCAATVSEHKISAKAQSVW